MIDLINIRLSISVRITPIFAIMLISEVAMRSYANGGQLDMTGKQTFTEIPPLKTDTYVNRPRY